MTSSASSAETAAMKAASMASMTSVTAAAVRFDTDFGDMCTDQDIGFMMDMCGIA